MPTFPNPPWYYQTNTPHADSAYKDSEKGAVIGGLATLATLTDNYIGAFKMPWGNYGKGVIAVAQGGATMFGDDNVHNDFSVYESTIPALSLSTDLNALNTGVVLQGVTSLRPKIPVKNWANYSTAEAYEKSYLTGLYHDGNQLYISAAMWYDTGETYNMETTAIITNASDLANSGAKGTFTLAGDRYANKWLSPIPEEHQAALGGDMLAGSSQSRIAGAGTLSKGPSLFAFSKYDIDNAANSATIATSEHLSYRNNWMVEDYLNYGGASGGVNNGIYGAESSASFGFIIPNTRTYCVVGRNAGYTPLPLDFTSPNGPYVDGSGSYPVDIADQGVPVGVPWAGTVTDFAAKNGTVFYKNNDASWKTKYGSIVDGYSAYNKGDSGYFYWMYDLDELVAATNPEDTMPYEYGRLTQPFEHNNLADGTEGGYFTSGSFDPVTKTLWLADPYLLKNVDGFEGQTVCMAYDFSGVV